MDFVIYTIFNIINGKFYIGKTSDFRARKSEHLSVARNKTKGKFSAIHKAIKKYGIHNFEFSILQKLKSELELSDAEKYWILFFRSNQKEFGYNLTQGGEGTLGHHHSKETKLKMKFAQLGQNNHNYGKLFSTETKSKISLNNHFASLNSDQVKLIRVLYLNGMSQKDIALQFNVKPNTISRIVKFKTWKYI